MKKLFLSLLALVAMVVTANAQRAWAYDLSLTSESESYTFTFKATTAATATLILSDEEGNNVGALDLGAVVAGSNTFTYTTDQLPKAGKMNWAVKLIGEAIADLVEVTDASKGIYNFYLPQGVAVDNNPESSTFGNIYVAQSTNGASDGGSTRADNQKQGIFIYDQTLAELNPTSNVGIIPSNVTLSATNNRQAMKRIVINPVTNEVAFIHNLDPVAIWAVPANNVGGEAKNLIDGLGFTAANAACFGEDGSLYVLVSPGYPAPGSLYKITDGVVDTLFANYGKFGNADVALASDGRGGVWIAQNRGQLDGFNQLTHVNAAGEIDFEVNSTTPNGIESANTARGTMAYNPNEDVLALGIGATNTIGASLYKVTYDAETGVPSLAFLAKTPSLGKNVDGLAFDYAGDLYGLSANKERFYKYAVPTNDNTCTTPAPKAQVVINTDQTVYAVTTVVNEEAMGTVTGAGNYLAGESATLTATANAGYRFVNWTVGEETNTENPLTLIVNGNLTVTANFAALPQYTITATANDAAMGSVTGAGTYYEGEEVTLKAIANPGHEFVDWNNGATEATLTFVAAKDSAVVANFKKLSYTVTAVVNDDAKGSVSGTGTYEYGEVATVEAVAADGYELLYWSDRSTENPRTVTVDGNKVLNAYFIKAYTQEPTFTIEKLWENAQVPASTGNGYQAVGWDGKIYMQDAGNSKIMSYANGTDAAVEYAASGVGQQIAVDEAGNLIVFNAYFAASTPNNILIYAKGSTEGKAVSFTLSNPGRCDFFSASGNIYSAEGGYVYFYCQNTTVVNRVKITNGAATAEDIVVDAVGSAITAGNSQNHVMVDIFGNLVAHSRSNGVNAINVLTNESKAFALPSIKMGTLGGCSFELGGKEFWAYHAGATNYTSEWNIYNMTDGIFLSDTVFYAKNKTDKNSAANWLNVQVVDEKTAYIYQFCPKVAVAVWKVTCDTGEEPGTGTAVENTTVAPQVQKIVREGQVLIIRDGKTFNMMGQEVK